MENNTTLVSFDVTSLYDFDIPHNFGLEAISFWMDKQGHQIDQIEDFQKSLYWKDYNSFLKTIISFLTINTSYKSKELQLALKLHKRMQL